MIDCYQFTTLSISIRLSISISVIRSVVSGVRSINTRMKITEITLAPTKQEDTRSSATRSSAITEDKTQDHVPQDIVPVMINGEIESHPDHSAIAEGVSQILRRAKKGTVKQGFRCSSGTRKGRIVAKPSTCFAKRDPVKGAKIRAKRQAKASLAGKKLAQTKRSGAGSLRLKGAQIKKTSQKGKSTASKLKARPPIKSKIIRPKKR